MKINTFPYAYSDMLISHCGDKCYYPIFQKRKITQKVLSRLTVQNFMRKQTVLKRKRNIPPKRPKNTLKYPW